ncbi:MAG: glutamine--fructose-6-phosphate transaminase (isomerizing) [Proteobacteria bacterium]|nr:glutamine--fructose-6-phosphate transaminase (isomerizing) [Pseudomonadota bacterium]
MCGIIGYLGPQDASEVILDGLERLEYRGYDSAGLAVIKDGGFEVRRAEGKLQKLEAILRDNPVRAHLGIGHTRWATHGRPNETNAHPHVSGRVAVVHNGIIENFSALKAELAADGRDFSSETDSEIIAHLIDRELSRNDDDLLAAMGRALALLEGSFALALLDHRHPDTLLAARKESPLILGLGEGEFFVASDVPAILTHTNRVVYLDDDELVEVGPDGYRVTDLAARPVPKEVQTISWSPVMAEKAGYKHFMLKEIFEQPRAVIDTIRGRLRAETGDVFPDDLGLGKMASGEIERLVIVACGTSWHAALVGKFLIEELARLPVEVDLGSEFRYRNPILDERTLLIGISQSGETADTLAAVREGRAKGARRLSICNVVGSTITRETEGVLYTHAGPEIGVASTKAFTTQLAALSMLAVHLAGVRGTMSQAERRAFLEEMIRLPRLMEDCLDGSDRIRSIARQLMNRRDFLYLGRGLLYPLALEGALKLKEISYIHAEGYPAGEMKHGPIALIDEDVPVVVAASGSSPTFDKAVSNMAEVAARQGELVVVSDVGPDRFFSDIPISHLIIVPETVFHLTPILFAIPLQLLAYHVADLRGTDVDQPRNLAKSVTVE